MSTTDTDKTDSSASSSDRTPAARALAIAIGMALMIATVLLAFSWPTLSAKPRHLPIDIVGTQEQIDQVTEQMGSAQAASGSTDALDLRTVDSREQAVENIETRDAVGAIVLPAESGQAPEVLVASGGNAQIASLMRTMASQMEDRANEQVIAGVEDKVGTMLEAQQLQQAAAQGDADAAAKLAALQSQQADQGQAGEDFTIPTVSVTVTDIVPLASGDSTGAGLALAALPLIMGGIGGAMMLSTAIKGLRRQLYSALIYSVMGGLVVTGILQGWFDVMQGSYWMNALIIGLEVAALSSTVIGAKNAFGNVGMAVVSVTMLLVGNPLSGATVPAYFLPSPWGAVGRLLPPGAALDLLRNVSYFPQAPSMTSWLVLLAWLALGIALNWVAKLRRVTLPARREAREAAQPAEATASA
ncbi:hypothetical protein QU670_00125 [Actinomyces massiliensis]|nr:hypothetical protein [Actinomyces massiliensis]WLD71703.1 hypothetical protein QU670_00125 [Actinomyces massiliensis]